MPGMGFLVGSESFVWSYRGLLKIRELTPEDPILGIDEEGRPCWSMIPEGIRKYGRTRIFRITTDGNEIWLSEACEAYTIEGVKKASGISKGDLLETFNIPEEIRLFLENKEPSQVMTDAGPIVIK